MTTYIYPRCKGCRNFDVRRRGDLCFLCKEAKAATRKPRKPLTHQCVVCGWKEPYNCPTPARKPRKARTAAGSLRNILDKPITDKEINEAMKGIPFKLHPKMRAKLKDYARRKLSPKQKVLRVHPKAVLCYWAGDTKYTIWKELHTECPMLGSGRTPAAAWRDAAKGLKG